MPLLWVTSTILHHLLSDSSALLQFYLNSVQFNFIGIVRLRTDMVIKQFYRNQDIDSACFDTWLVWSVFSPVRFV